MSDPELDRELRPGPAPAAGSVPLHVILVEPEIGPNVGNIGRTCVAIGAMLWLVRPLGFDLTDRQLRRAGLDYWPHLHWRPVDSFQEAVSTIGTDRLWLFTTRTDRPYTAARFRHGDALVFGRESRGLPDSLLSKYPDRLVRIPMRSEARSLNLSNSVAVGLYEAHRQVGLASLS
jgi:tRNA (cytidine/uridine-2'-O-)-methyltransferase